MAKEKVIIERKTRLTESKYSVGIYVDGEFVVNTIECNRQEIELELGKHILKVKQGNRSGEIEIDVKKGKVTTCVFTSTFLTNVNYLFFIFATIIYYGLKQKHDGPLFLFIPTILISIYTFTFGRQSYFVFEKPTEEHSWYKE